jgi:hypothetical protein
MRCLGEVQNTRGGNFWRREAKKKHEPGLKC